MPASTRIHSNAGPGHGAEAVVNAAMVDSIGAGKAVLNSSVCSATSCLVRLVERSTSSLELVQPPGEASCSAVDSNAAGASADAFA